MGVLIEIVFAIVLHPLAVILVWINLSQRTDLGFVRKLLWGLLSLVWGVGPLLLHLPRRRRVLVAVPRLPTGACRTRRGCQKLQGVSCRMASPLFSAAWRARLWAEIVAPILSCSTLA